MPAGNNQNSLAKELEEILSAAPSELPLMPLRNAVAFPLVVMPLAVGRSMSLKVLEEVARTHKFLGLVTQKVPEIEEPGLDDLYRVGCLARILKIMKGQDDTQTILAQGLARFKILEPVRKEPYIVVKYELVTPPEYSAEDKEIEARMLLLKQNALQMVRLVPNVPEEAAAVIQNIDHPGALADVIIANLNVPVAEKQAVLETFDIKTRLQLVAKTVGRELEVLELSNKIQQEVKDKLDKSHRDYYLREQMKVIQQELGEDSEQKRESNQLRERIQKASPPAEVMQEVERELNRFATMNPAAADYSTSRTYLEWIAELPWSKLTEDKVDINKAEKILNEDHYDLEKVKKRILEFLAVRKLNPTGRGPILCFVGPPGVGKTSLGRSIARAMGREFFRMSLGGLHDEAEIRGHRRTYVGAMPGRIIQGIRRAGTRNPVFMLDEIDKVGMDFRGDPSSALLEVLDPEQNWSFADNYLNVPFDLSKVIFITTGNMLDTIPRPLLDRMEVLTLPGYTDRDKLQIAKKYLVLRQLKENGLTAKNLRITDAGILTIIHDYTREAGVRNLERTIAAVCRGVARNVAAGKAEKVALTPKNAATYLGPVCFWAEAAERTAMPGVATGLAWTPTGGEIIFIEATSMSGKGSLIMTGQLGDVMKESAQAALSYIRAHAAQYGVEPEFFAKNDIHLHIPAGAIPKDGPSAGVAMLTAMVSMLTGKKVMPDVAMTGEITLRGRVLPVGGIKEKLLAAHRAQIKKVIMPKKNEKDLEDVPKEVRSQMEVVFVENMNDVPPLAIVDLKPVAPARTNSKKNSNKAKKKETAKTPKTPSKRGKR